MKKNILIIGCSEENEKNLRTLANDKVFVCSLAALKYEKCPDSLTLCIRICPKELYEHLQNKK